MNLDQLARLNAFLSGLESLLVDNDIVPRGSFFVRVLGRDSAAKTVEIFSVGNESDWSLAVVMAGRSSETR